MNLQSIDTKDTAIPTLQKERAEGSPTIQTILPRFNMLIIKGPENVLLSEHPQFLS